jgi:hypothetical protein
MRTLRDWNITIDADMVLREQGADPAVLRARSPAIVAATERAAQTGLRLLDPAVIYRRLQVTGVRHERLMLAGGAFLSGPLITGQLSAAEHVAIMVCTIGDKLEQRASFEMENDPAYGLALDSLGSIAVGLLAAEACGYAGDQAAAEGMDHSIPLNPGLIGWPLDVGQRQIFGLLDTDQIGVTLTAGSQMIPRKSISLVIGFGRNITCAGSPCDYCDVRARCRHHERYRNPHC